MTGKIGVQIVENITFFVIDLARFDY